MTDNELMTFYVHRLFFYAEMKGSEIMDGKNAKRSDEITDEMWLEVNEFNRNMVEEYLDNQAELSVKSKIGYESGLRIFFYWVKEHLNNKIL